MNRVCQISASDYLNVQQLYLFIFVYENVTSWHKNMRSDTHIFDTRHCIDSIFPKQFLWHIFETPFLKFHQFQSLFEGIWFVFRFRFVFLFLFILFAFRVSLVCMCMCVCVRARVWVCGWLSALHFRSHAYIVQHFYVKVSFTTIELPYDFLTVKKK